MHRIEYKKRRYAHRINQQSGICKSLNKGGRTIGTEEGLRRSNFKLPSLKNIMSHRVERTAVQCGKGGFKGTVS